MTSEEERIVELERHSTIQDARIDAIINSVEEFRRSNAEFREDMRRSNAEFREEMRRSNAEFREEMRRSTEDFKAEMRQQNEMRAAEIREINARFYAKTDAIENKIDALELKFDSVTNNVRNMSWATIAGVAAIAIAAFMK